MRKRTFSCCCCYWNCNNLATSEKMPTVRGDVFTISMSVLTLVILFKLENAKDAYLISATRPTLALMHLLKFNSACFRAYARKSGLSQSVISHAIFSSHIVHEHACIHDGSHTLMHLCSHVLHCCVHMVLFRSILFDKFSFAYSVLSN